MSDLTSPVEVLGGEYVIGTPIPVTRKERVALWNGHRQEIMDSVDTVGGWLGWMEMKGYLNVDEGQKLTLKKSIAAWVGSQELKTYQQQLLDDTSNPLKIFVDKAPNKYAAAAKARKAEKVVHELNPENSDEALGMVAYAMMLMAEKEVTPKEWRQLLGKESLEKIVYPNQVGTVEGNFYWPTKHFEDEKPEKQQVNSSRFKINRRVFAGILSTGVIATVAAVGSQVVYVLSLGLPAEVIERMGGVYKMLSFLAH